MRIIIEGRQGEGKSTVARWLAAMLHGFGFQVRLQDEVTIPVYEFEAESPTLPDRLRGKVAIEVRQEPG